MATVLARGAVAQSASGGEPSVGELIRAFESVVFGTEFKDFESLAGRRWVWKWETPLRVVVRNFRETVVQWADGGERLVLEQTPVTERQLEPVRRHLESLVAITSLQTDDSGPPGAEANFVINFVPRLQMANPGLADLEPRLMRQMASQGGCYFALWPTKEDGRIDRTIIVVNRERSDENLDHCLLEEMTQALGLPNDVRVRWPSVFSERDQLTDLNVYDRLFIRTLYDRRIRAGMAKAEGLRIARRILGERNPSTE